MPREPKIRVTRADQQIIREINRKISAKKSYIKRQYQVKVDQPTRPIKSFSTRKEFKKYVEESRDFLKTNKNWKGVNQHGTELNRKEVKEYKRTIRKINREKEKEFNRIKNEAFRDRGKPTELNVGEQKGLMGDTRYSDLKPLKFNPGRFRNKKDFREELKKQKEKLKGEGPIAKKQALYKTNYIKALDNVFGKMAKPLIEAVKMMEPSKFSDLYHTENIADIKFIYDFMEMTRKYKALKGLFGI